MQAMSLQRMAGLFLVSALALWLLFPQLPANAHSTYSAAGDSCYLHFGNGITSSGIATGITNAQNYDDCTSTAVRLRYVKGGTTYTTPYALNNTKLVTIRRDGVSRLVWSQHYSCTPNICFISGDLGPNTSR